MWRLAILLMWRAYRVYRIEEGVDVETGPLMLLLSLLVLRRHLLDLN